VLFLRTERITRAMQRKDYNWACAYANGSSIFAEALTGYIKDLAGYISGA
jgi:hypothetical protein